MMAWEDEQNAQPEEEALPSMSPEDRLTYDPTQGQGTPAWQAAVKKQMEHNAQLRRN